MQDNFDIKQYLIENKMTRNSRLLNEAYEIYDDEDNVVSSLPDEVTLDEQEPSLEDELMAQLDEKVGPWSLKKGDQHPENFEPSYDDEDYEAPEEEYEEHESGEEELDEMDFDSLEEEINAMLEADNQEELNEDIYSDLATFVAGPAAVGAVSVGIAKLMDALETGKLGGEKR
jgi:hypothetical protein